MIYTIDNDVVEAESPFALAKALIQARKELESLRGKKVYYEVWATDNGYNWCWGSVSKEEYDAEPARHMKRRLIVLED